MEQTLLTPPKGIDVLCGNAATATFEDLSQDNIRILRDRLLDITGCIFGGCDVKEDRFVTQFFQEKGGKAEAPVFTKSFRLPILDAVQLNSMYARANDFGCMFFHIFGEHIASHCSETLIPTNLTLAAAKGASGKEFVTNEIVAEDFTSRILYSLPVRWPTDMLLVSTGAAVVASRYYGLDATHLKTALGYATANCTDPGNAYYDYSQEFKWHNAESARAGIMAVRFAQGGWKGYEDPYFGHWGLVSKQIKDGNVLPACYEKCFENLGGIFFTEESFKRYPGGIPTSSAADCGKDIRNQIIKSDGVFDAGTVKGVHVFRSQDVRYNYYSNPFRLRNHTNALFSFQFSACCALCRGTIGVTDVQTETILASPDVYRLAEESTMDVFTYEKPAMKVVVEMTDGRTFTSIQDYSASMHAYPSTEFLVAKFRSQSDYAGVRKSVQDKIIYLASRIEELPDMREYTDLLSV